MLSMYLVLVCFFLSSDQNGAVDETLLRQLEDSLSDAQRDVEGRLRPRLRDMEEREAAQRRRLNGINLDIDTILRDIANLEDILKAVPNGCFNSPPIEEAWGLQQSARTHCDTETFWPERSISAPCSSFCGLFFLNSKIWMVQRNFLIESTVFDLTMFLHS